MATSSISTKVDREVYVARLQAGISKINDLFEKQDDIDWTDKAVKLAQGLLDEAREPEDPENTAEDFQIALSDALYEWKNREDPTANLKSYLRRLTYSYNLFNMSAQKQITVREDDSTFRALVEVEAL